MSNPFADNSDHAADASIQGSQMQAAYQKEALDYLKETEKLPQEIREGALGGLAGVAGLPGGTGSQQDLINRAIASPLYGAIMGGQEQGEDAILRHAAATGGLRSGNTQGAMYDYNTQLQNKALLESYNQQLGTMQGLAGLPSNANQIAGMTSGIGQTLSQGQIAAAQAMQQGQQNTAGNLMGLGQLGILGAGMFSDRRMKTKIKKIGTMKGWNWYSFEWNKVAEKLGLKGKCQGYMAEEVFAERPDCVIIKDLFMFVLYGKLGIIGGAA